MGALDCGECLRDSSGAEIIVAVELLTEVAFDVLFYIMVTCVTF